MRRFTGDVPPIGRIEFLATTIRRDRMVRRVTKAIERASPGLPTVDAIARAARKALGQAIPLGAVEMSLGGLVRTPPTPADVRTACWRLAGAVEQLRMGIAVSADEWKIRDGWCGIKIVTVTPATSRFKKRGAHVGLRVLSGVAAGTYVRTFWSQDLFRALSVRVGFTRSRGLHPFRDPRELVGLRLAGYSHPETAGDTPGFARHEVPNSAKAYNRKLIRSRARDGFDCPARYPLELVPCYRCPMGRDYCPVATHAKTYVLKMCSECHQEAPHDPSRPAASPCVACCHRRDEGQS